MGFAPDFRNRREQSTRFYPEGHRSETYSVGTLEHPQPYRPPNVYPIEAPKRVAYGELNSLLL